MKYITPILYGLIVGQWLCNVRRRLFPGKVNGRYAVVGMHSGKEEFVLVGHSADKNRAMTATNYLEENTMFYIGICYDLLDPDDRMEFEKRLYCPYIEKEDEVYVHEAMRICSGK